MNWSGAFWQICKCLKGRKKWLGRKKEDMYSWFLFHVPREGSDDTNGYGSESLANWTLLTFSSLPPAQRAWEQGTSRADSWPCFSKANPSFSSLLRSPSVITCRDPTDSAQGFPARIDMPTSGFTPIHISGFFSSVLFRPGTLLAHKRPSRPCVGVYGVMPAHSMQYDLYLFSVQNPHTSRQKCMTNRHKKERSGVIARFAAWPEEARIVWRWGQLMVRFFIRIELFLSEQMMML